MPTENIKSHSNNFRIEIDRLNKQLSEQRQLESQLKATLHELHVHQEELRTQNEDLLTAQEELAVAHRKYLDLFDHAPIGYFVLGLHGRIQEANLVAADLLARSRSSIINKPLWLYLRKEDNDRFQAHLRRILSGNSAFMETSLITTDEKTVPVELHSIPVYDGGKETASCRIAVLDITKREDVEKRLRETNQQLDSVLSTIPDVVYRLNRDGIVEYISPTVQRYGYDPEDICGKHFIHLVHPKYRYEAQEQFAKQVESGTRISDVEFGFLTNGTSAKHDASKKEVFFSLSSSVLYDTDADGEKHLTGIQGIAHDITEKKRRLNEQLQLKEQLQKKQRMEAIGALAGGVAHDFNNLMTGIQGSVSLLKILHQKHDKTAELLTIIEKSVTHGRNLTKQLLGFARGGKYVVKSTNVNKTLASCLNLFNPIQKNVSVIKNLAEELWNVQADEGQIEQVFINLFINAAQAMADGGTLELSTQNLVLSSKNAELYGVQKGNYVLITIKDSGIGMDKVTCEHIFEPFFTTKSNETGSGLGLASAYGIINNHDGAIQAKSELGKGSTFTIILPAQPEAVVTTTPAPVSRVQKGQGNILVVDDNLLVADILSQMLASLGYTVEKVHSGTEALEIYQENWQNFSLVFLDILMPDMNGLAVYSRLAEINPEIKVVFSSGYSPDEPLENILRTQKQYFLQKPFRLEELSEMMLAHDKGLDLNN